MDKQQLLHELIQCDSDIRETIDEAKVFHAIENPETSVYAMRSPDGRPMLADLLAAQANVLCAIERIGE